MDNMPDFDSMTPEEMMAWMEALAKRQGATEGLVTAGDMDVPEIDPESVAIDEPGYIPFGMDPEVWAQKKAKEDAERAERIAAMKAEKAASPPSMPAASAAPVDREALDQTNPLDFLADMSAAPDVPSFDFTEEPAEAELGFDFDAQDVGQELPAFEAMEDAVSPQAEAPLDDLFTELASADVTSGSGDMEWLSSLGEAALDLPDLEALDFGSLEMLEEPAAQAESNPLEWLESLVSGDSDRVEAVAEEEPPSAQAAAIADMEEMLLEDADILEDSAVSAVLNDPMEWLADFAESSPMDALAGQAADAPASADDLNAFFDRLQTGEEALEAAGDEQFDAGLIDFGGTPSFEEDELGLGIGSALTQGADVPAEDMKVWMDSLLDRGIQRTDVTDEDDEDTLAEAGELPSWLVEQVGTPPATTDELLAAESDLPDWLTAPVSDEQNLEFEEIFSQLQAEPMQEEDRFSSAELEIADVAPLDTGAIRVQMDDPWVEAFELERDERLSDTGKLAAWYESAAHEVEAARQSEAHRVQETASQPVLAQPASSSLKSAQLPVDEELPPGEPQSVPTWLGGTAAAAMSPVPPAITPIVQPPAFAETPETTGSDEELPDWLRAAQLESDEATQVPSWLTDSLTTDEFAILQLDRNGQPLPHPMQDEPTTPVTVIPAGQPTAEKPITQRATSEARTTSVRPTRETIPVHEAANVLNQARASQKMGDVGAMLDSYERLIRSEVALEEVETDMERVAKDAVHKSNPSVLRVYGDALLRRGKLQQALDTYRSALNLL
jgi:hypothetical protein